MSSTESNHSSGASVKPKGLHHSRRSRLMRRWISAWLSSPSDFRTTTAGSSDPNVLSLFRLWILTLMPCVRPQSPRNGESGQTCSNMLKQGREGSGLLGGVLWDILPILAPPGVKEGFRGEKMDPKTAKGHYPSWSLPLYLPERSDSVRRDMRWAKLTIELLMVSINNNVVFSREIQKLWFRKMALRCCRDDNSGRKRIVLRGNVVQWFTLVCARVVAVQLQKAGNQNLLPSSKKIPKPNGPIRSGYKTEHREVQRNSGRSWPALLYFFHHSEPWHRWSGPKRVSSRTFRRSELILLISKAYLYILCRGLLKWSQLSKVTGNKQIMMLYSNNMIR